MELLRRIHFDLNSEFYIAQYIRAFLQFNTGCNHIAGMTIYTGLPVSGLPAVPISSPMEQVAECL